jgi:Sigma-70 factor, region 1.2
MRRTQIARRRDVGRSLAGSAGQHGTCLGRALAQSNDDSTRRRWSSRLRMPARLLARRRQRGPARQAGDVLDEAEEETEVCGNVDDDRGRTDDPVRMYLREMGSVELLSREGEIAIAKRIEAGREMMIGGICESPLTMRAIIAWRDALTRA